MRRVWYGIGWLGIALLLYLSLAQLPPALSVDHSDKLGHLLAYCVLTYGWAQLLPAIRQRFWLGLGFITLGIALEYLQLWTSWHTFDYYDMVANTIGVAAGGILATVTPSVFLLAGRLGIRTD